VHQFFKLNAKAAFEGASGNGIGLRHLGARRRLGLQRRHEHPVVPDEVNADLTGRLPVDPEETQRAVHAGHDTLHVLSAVGRLDKETVTRICCLLAASWRRPAQAGFVDDGFFHGQLVAPTPARPTSRPIRAKIVYLTLLAPARNHMHQFTGRD